MRDRLTRFLEVAMMLSWLVGGSTPITAADATPAEGPRAILPDGRTLQLEIARTPASRQQGYMFRERVGREEGMLFLFPESGFHSFWMKNCKVPLDIIWMDEELRIVYVETEVPPCPSDPCPGYLPLRKARYVLEIQAGSALSSGVQSGVRIRFEEVDWKVPAPQ